LLTESSDPETGKTDFVGYVLGPLMLGLLVFAIILGETMGYTSWKVLTLFGAGVLALVLFILAEQRAKAPMLELRYFRRPPFSGSLTVAFAAYFGVFSIFFLTALYLQIVIGYSAFRIATLFVPMALAMIIASAFAGPWVGRSGPRLPVAIGCFAAGVGVLLTNLALAGEVTFTPLILALTLTGAGFGIAVVPITSVALSVIPARHSGMAASATTTSREVGTVIGVAALGSLFNTKLIDFLTARLIQLEVPPEFRDLVINAVLTGQMSGSEEAEKIYGPVVAKVIGAAYEAVHSGVSFSLLVAGCVILLSGLVAWLTFSPRRLELE
jgi:predicted MFS family arabinose efflux permease